MYVCCWCIARRHFVVLLPWVVIVSQLEVLIVGRFCWFMYVCHVSWMICDVAAVGLGSLVCSWDDGSIRMASRVDRAVSSLGWGRGLSPLCSFRVSLLR